MGVRIDLVTGRCALGGCEVGANARAVRNFDLPE